MVFLADIERMRDERKGFVMKRILSLLLCAALLLPCALSCAESAAFDGSVFAGKKGYTLREDGSWTCVRGAEFPYPGFVIAVRISVSGKGDGTVEAPQLEVGLLKSSGSDEAAMDVTGAAFYMRSKAYAYENLPAGSPYACVPLYTQGKELVQALSKVTELTVRVFYKDNTKSVYDINNYFKEDLSAAAKDLLAADVWAYLTDADGKWAEAEAAFPLKISDQ